MFIIASAFVGTLVGHLYGLAFLHEKKQVHPDASRRVLAQKLSISGILRYLLLAGCLWLRFSRNLVHPMGILGGVLIGFWLVVIKQTRSRNENRII